MKEIKNFPVADLTPFPLINAVVLNLQKGKFFSDDKEQLFFIFHKSGFSYLSENKEPGYTELLEFFLQSKELPGYFHIYDAPGKLIDVCNENKERVNIKLRRRIQLKYQKDKLSPAKMDLPSGFTLGRINNLNFDKLSVFNLSLESKFWKSKEDFLNNGFGFTVNDEADLPVSICYAACVANHTAEIDVATLKSFQQRGLAKAAVASFIQHCLANNITPNWDCFEDNFGSIKTAMSLKFEIKKEYSFLTIIKQ